MFSNHACEVPTGVVYRIWRILGFGFHLTASWPQKLMTDLSGWLEVALSVILGLIPYLLADLVWRHIRNR